MVHRHFSFIPANCYLIQLTQRETLYKSKLLWTMFDTETLWRAWEQSECYDRWLFGHIETSTFPTYHELDARFQKVPQQNSNTIHKISISGKVNQLPHMNITNSPFFTLIELTVVRSVLEAEPLVTTDVVFVPIDFFNKSLSIVRVMVLMFTTFDTPTLVTSFPDVNLILLLMLDMSLRDAPAGHRKHIQNPVGGFQCSVQCKLTPDRFCQHGTLKALDDQANTNIRKTKQSRFSMSSTHIEVHGRQKIEKRSFMLSLRRSRSKSRPCPYAVSTLVTESLRISRLN